MELRCREERQLAHGLTWIRIAIEAKIQVWGPQGTTGLQPCGQGAGAARAPSQQGALPGTSGLRVHRRTKVASSFVCLSLLAPQVSAGCPDLSLGLCTNLPSPHSPAGCVASLADPCGEGVDACPRPLTAALEDVRASPQALHWESGTLSERKWLWGSCCGSTGPWC